MTDLFTEFLQKLALSAGLLITAEQLEKMSAFYAMMEEANRSFNLTSIAGPEESAERHFMDSLAVPAMNLLFPGEHVIDVGTGAGFPGVPVAILRNNLHITLLDSMKKRTSFLVSAVEKLGLHNVSIVTARAEDYSRSAGREAFDAALSRAVAPLNVLLEYTLPFVRIGGRVLAWKGPAANDEITAAARANRLLGGGEMKAFSYSLADRSNFNIIEIKKIRLTPTNYPRKAGKPTSEPII